MGCAHWGPKRCAHVPAHPVDILGETVNGIGGVQSSPSCHLLVHSLFPCLRFFNKWSIEPKRHLTDPSLNLSCKGFPHFGAPIRVTLSS